MIPHVSRTWSRTRLWFDGLDHQENYNGRRFHDLIHRLRPSTLINNRIGPAGDYDPPEQFTPKFIPTWHGSHVQQKLPPLPALMIMVALQTK